MKPTFWQRLDQMARNLVPFALTIGLVLISAIPTHIPGYAGISPMLALIGIYYWSIARPDLMRPGLVLIIGFLTDVLVGLPLGLNALVFLLVHGGVALQRRYFLGKPFHVGWWGFGVVAIGVALTKWVLVSTLLSGLVEASAVLFSTLLTIFLYPLIGGLFAGLQGRVVREA